MSCQDECASCLPLSRNGDFPVCNLRVFRQRVLMKAKMAAPPHANLTQTCYEIACEFGVSLNVAHRWKKEAGIPMHRGGSGLRKNSPARLVKPEEWAKGCYFVGRLLGISRQAALSLRNKLIEEGHVIPTRKRGQVDKQK